jgi:protein-tyrosine phosphatase
MAEYLLQRAFARRGIEQIVVESAGTAAWDGSPAASRAIMEMKRRGIDMTPHRSKLLTPAMVDEAELVLVMEHAHASVIRRAMPESVNKVRLLGSFVAEYGDLEIGDPYGGPPEFFAKCCDIIEAAVDAVAEEMTSGDHEVHD